MFPPITVLKYLTIPQSDAVTCRRTLDPDTNFIGSSYPPPLRNRAADGHCVSAVSSARDQQATENLTGPSMVSTRLGSIVRGTQVIPHHPFPSPFFLPSSVIPFCQLGIQDAGGESGDPTVVLVALSFVAVVTFNV